MPIVPASTRNENRLRVADKASQQIGDDDLLHDIVLMHATARTRSQFLLITILRELPVFKPLLLLILPVLAVFRTTVLKYS